MAWLMRADGKEQRHWCLTATSATRLMLTVLGQYATSRRLSSGRFWLTDNRIISVQILEELHLCCHLAELSFRAQRFSHAWFENMLAIRMRATVMLIKRMVVVRCLFCFRLIISCFSFYEDSRPSRLYSH